MPVPRRATAAAVAVTKGNVIAQGRSKAARRPPTAVTPLPAPPGNAATRPTNPASRTATAAMVTAAWPASAAPGNMGCAPALAIVATRFPATPIVAAPQTARAARPTATAATGFAPTPALAAFRASRTGSTGFPDSPSAATIPIAAPDTATSTSAATPRVRRARWIHGLPAAGSCTHGRLCAERAELLRERTRLTRIIAAPRAIARPAMPVRMRVAWASRAPSVVPWTPETTATRTKAA